MELIGEILIFFVTGILTGLLSTLFGIGGGLIVVPMCYLIFHFMGYSSSVVMHVALGTSLAVMIITVSNSLYQHHRSGNILKQVVWPLFPFVALGAILGSIASDFVHSDWLRYFFMFFLAFVILNALIDKSFQTTRSVDDIKPFQPWLRVVVGFFTGIISVLLGVAGSVITVPYFRKHNVPMANASACALCLAPAVAIFGIIGYLVTGWDATNLPPYCLGYVNLPAGIALAAGTFFGAPMGVKLLTRFEDQVIAKAYIGLLVCTLILMAVG